MSIESIERELQGYIPSWQDQPREQAVAEIASCISETRRTPDYYKFFLTPSGELFSPDYNCIVKEKIKRIGHPGEAEYEAVLHIETIVCEHDSGLIVWISPRCLGTYPTTKVIYSEINKQGMATMLWNRAIIYDDLSDAEVLQLAKTIAQKDSSNPIPGNLEDVRKRPIYIPTGGMHWTYIIGEYLTIDRDWRLIRAGDDIKIKEQFLKEAEDFYNAVIKNPYEPISEHMHIFGQGELSCPRGGVTAFNMLFRMNKDGWTGYCPLCGAYNEGLKPGDRCQGCKEVYQGCR